MTVLRMSVQAGLMVLAVVFLRVTALDRVPKKTFPVLWGLVLARMLIPLSVPFKWSIFNLLHVSSGNAMPALTNGVNRLNLPEAAAVRNPAPLIARLRPVWLVGMLLFLSVFMFIILRSYRRLRDAVPYENEIIRDWMPGRRLRRPLRILQSDRIQVPLAIGIVRPRIIFPTAPKARPEEIRFILEHEYYHIRRFDMMWKLLALAAVSVHWFNPLGWLMLKLLNRDLEITCDDMVIQRFGGGADVKKAYAFSLIEMEARKSGNSLVYNSFGKNATEERVKMIMNNKKIPVWAVILALVLVTASVLTFATAARPSEAGNMDTGADGLIPVYGHHAGGIGRGIIEVDTLDIQADGDRIIDWKMSVNLFRLDDKTTKVIDSDGNLLPGSNIKDICAGVHPHAVTVWYDPENMGEEAPRVIDAAAVRVELEKQAFSD